MSLADIAKRLNVDEAAVRQLYEEMVAADTGMSYADVAAKLSTVLQDAPPAAADTEEAEVANFVNQLATAWGVDVNAANQRLTQLNTVYEGLPEAQRDTYASLDGIKQLWDLYSVMSPQAKQSAAGGNAAPDAANVGLDGVVVKNATAPIGITPASLLTKRQQGTSFDFDNLLTMPDEEYARIASDGSLLAAFNAGRVRDTQGALLPESVQRSAVTGNFIG